MTLILLKEFSFWQEENKEAKMANLTKDYADAWSTNQGNYSESLAKKLISFLKLQKIEINSVLDVCCGSANFLRELQKIGVACTGTEILDSYIDYNTEHFPNIRFIKTDSILDFDSTGKYDLISCNHDVVNMLPTAEDWNIFFKQAYNHLNNGGLLFFDFYTKKKLQNWNEVIFDESDKLDYIKTIESVSDNETKITNIFYTNINYDETTENIGSEHKEYSYNDYNKKFKKNEYSTSEHFFDNSEILDMIKKNGYRYLITTDASLSPVSNISEMNRVHVIAIKREN